MAYGKVRPPALTAPVASFTHRASGDAILVLVVVVALLCLAKFGLEDDGAVHAVSGGALFVALGLKLAVAARRRPRKVEQRVRTSTATDRSGSGDA